MKIKLGIIGLPNVGKSTLFNALTSSSAEVSNYPFCTINPNIADVPVPDERLLKLTEIIKPQKAIPAHIKFVDIAGLVKGASKGEGLGNRFLSHIREVDAIVHAVRCFSDENIAHIEGRIAPGQDAEIVNLELLFADLETISNRIEKTRSMVKTHESKYITEFEILKKFKEEIEKGEPVRNIVSNNEEKKLAEELFLLTFKPMIYVANVSEKDAGKEINDIDTAKELLNYAQKNSSEVIAISAKIEEELIQLDTEERAGFMEELGIPESGIEKLTIACYKLLNLISFFTIKLPEVRAWKIIKGTKAPQAAGKIHSDFEKGFICAEVIDYDTLVTIGSFNTAKEKGLIRQEGKDYIIKDGDIALFKFNI